MKLIRQTSKENMGDRRFRSISLVLPAYNEEASIVEAVQEGIDVLSRLAGRYEILVVDDGSRDATAARVERRFGDLDCVRLLQHPSNIGYGAALRSGFSAARYELVACTDADRQFHLEDLSLLLDRMGNSQAACGYRLDRQDHWLRLVYSKAYNHLVRGLLGIPVRDCDCALKIFRRSTLQSLPLRSSGFLIDAEILARLSQRDLRITEVGVRHRPRLVGQSTVSPMHALPVLTELLRFWWSDHLFPEMAGYGVPGSKSFLGIDSSVTGH